jgi:hypothetical protein
MSHKITCIITGKSITVSNEYYDKKVSEFGTEDKFNSSYISRQVKNLLKRGYKVKDVKKLLKIEDDSLPEISEAKLKTILKMNDDDIPDMESSSIKKSHPDIVEYIKTLREYLSNKSHLEAVQNDASVGSK